MKIKLYTLLLLFVSLFFVGCNSTKPETFETKQEVVEFYRSTYGVDKDSWSVETVESFKEDISSVK